MKLNNRSVVGFTVLVIGSFLIQACGGASQYFGKTETPRDNILRYVSGSEPESLDPHVSSGQPEARIYMALFDGLVEYGPKDLQPIPAIAKSWETGPGVDTFIFHLRDNARWSDGKPITAEDFVYSLRRGFAPETLSRTASLGYFVKYAEAYNSGRVFVRKNGRYITGSDLDGTPKKQRAAFGPDTEFDRSLRDGERITLDADPKKREKEIETDPKLRAAAEGAEFVPVSENDIGVEAIDAYTLRISLRQPAPFFVGLLAHQFFRLVPRHAIERYGKQWTRPENIVTCGAFKMQRYVPYNVLAVTRDPMYWDAANVHLDGIEFYPVEELSTIMNLYKGGQIDAMLNHSVPSSWIGDVRQYKDEYLNFAEAATAYYSMNMTKPPFNDIRVRRAFQLAVDRKALSDFRKVTKPLNDITPDGIFPDYDRARAAVADASRAKAGLSVEEWDRKHGVDPEAARRSLTEAGFPVIAEGNGFACPTFPTDTVSLTFNTNENNRAVAEFVQAQWKKNLGVTIPLKSQEFKTFLKDRNELNYVGFAQSLWSGDYMDPFTFLGLHYAKQNDGGSGFYDPKYDKLLDDANNELDPQKRYELLARAEAYVMDQLPVVTLTVNATNWLKKPYVKGMYPNPGTLHAWKFVYIETDRSRWDRDVEGIMTGSDARVDQQLAELTSSQRGQ